MVLVPVANIAMFTVSIIGIAIPVFTAIVATVVAIILLLVLLVALAVAVALTLVVVVRYCYGAEPQDGNEGASRNSAIHTHNFLSLLYESSCTVRTRRGFFWT
jgi:hypothetical protein